MILTHVRLLVHGDLLDDCWIRMVGHQIDDFGPMHDEIQGVSMEGRLVVPGFIDQHVHGCMGSDFMDGTVDAIERITSALPSEGVTSILATTTTDAGDKIHKALETIAHFESSNGSEILGIHLEGPFLSRKAPGAHLTDLMQTPTVEQFESFQESAQGRIKMVTLAVEEDEGFALTKHLKSRGVVPSVGHSVATYTQTVNAVKAGCSCATHCYNAMKGLHHRDGGVVGATLLTDGLKAELIADRIHVSDEAVQVYDRMKNNADKILITDAMRAKGLDKGEYNLCGQTVISYGHEVRTPEGVLAGSVLMLDAALRNYVEVTGRSLIEVIQMLTENPAKLHGVYDRKGSIAKGKDADLVVLDDNLEVYMTLCRGKVAYSRDYENHSS